MYRWDVIQYFSNLLKSNVKKYRTFLTKCKFKENMEKNKTFERIIIKKSEKSCFLTLLRGK